MDQQMIALSRYALVNIVMGDIADIEKKKSKGLSTLLLGAKPNQMVQVLKSLWLKEQKQMLRVLGRKILDIRSLCPQGAGGMKGKGFHVDVVQEHLEKEAEVGSHLEGGEVCPELSSSRRNKFEYEKQIEIKPTKDRLTQVQD